MMVLEHLFYEISLILAASAVLGALSLWLRQPLIIAFIVVGILVGPSGLNLPGVDQRVALLAEIGITVLLFVVGLKLDLHLIRSMGPVALATGLGQVAFTSLFGYLIALALGLSTVGALYVAVALTFSSTIIIVKLLSDKKEIDALHGRIAVGFLIVQDIAVIVAMIGLTALGAEEASDHLLVSGMVVVAKGVAFLGTVGLMMHFILPRLLPHLARSPELLVLSAIAWAVLLASVGDYLGFSKEVGAFLAGVSLASTSFREAIATRLVSLRDFLLIFFFIGLGAQLDLSMLGTQIVPALIFSVFVLIGNPLIVMVIMGLMGYRKRTSFLAGLTVAQISEFSLILGALGVSLGHIDRETLGLITLVGLITIGTSTYMILYSHPLYNRLSPLLGLFERRHPHREHEGETATDSRPIDVLLLGLGRYGRNIAENLVARDKQLLAVDFDPAVVREAGSARLQVRYGDAADPELLEHLPVEQARWVVNTIPGREANLTILAALRAQGYSGKVVLTAHNSEEDLAYHHAGADTVLRPYIDAASLAVDYLTGTREELTTLSPWELNLEEITLPAGSVGAGKLIRELALRPAAGVSIVAVSRSGRSYLDPDSDFRLYPGDRLVLLGGKEGLTRTRGILQEPERREEERCFQMAEVTVTAGSELAGRLLADLDLRRRQEISVIGIQRGGERSVSPLPDARLEIGDILLVIGPCTVVKELQGSHQPAEPGQTRQERLSEPIASPIRPFPVGITQTGKGDTAGK
jgi:Kef-type K+ transport system membrane component KefB/Trk K+ transport system NAD-binding subunit